MAAALACIAGEDIHRQWDAGQITGQKIGRRDTPFGPSGEVFLIERESGSFHLLSRYEPGLRKVSPARVNYRANMYALKDLGCEQVLAWGPAGAITHNVAIGDLVVLSDVLDMTHLRERTFFEESPLGFLRQFPVFCPTLRDLVCDAIHSAKMVYQPGAIAAVVEGPRLETPAEVQFLARVGAGILTHAFVPEVFLARELEMCYAAVGYIVNYAETGSRHPPFRAGGLFAGLPEKPDSERIRGAVARWAGLSAPSARR